MLVRNEVRHRVLLEWWREDAALTQGAAKLPEAPEFDLCVDAGRDGRQVECVPYLDDRMGGTGSVLSRTLRAMAVMMGRRSR